MRALTLAAALLMAVPAPSLAADDYPPGLFEKSPEVPELTCDMQHQCYHMDPAHPDKVTPPPAPQYPGVTSKPFVQPAPEALAPPPVADPNEEDPHDPYSCFSLRRGLFPTPQAAASARARCH